MFRHVFLIFSLFLFSLPSLAFEESYGPEAMRFHHDAKCTREGLIAKVHISKRPYSSGQGEVEIREPYFSYHFIYGPYVSLEAGYYEASFELQFFDGFDTVEAKNYVEVNSGSKLFARHFFNDKTGAKTLTISFYLAEKTDNIEFRVWWAGLASLLFKRVTVKKIGEPESGVRSALARAHILLQDSPYRLVSDTPLGQGANGLVYKLERLEDGKPYVLKIVSHLAHDVSLATKQTSFRHELKSARSIKAINRLLDKLSHLHGGGP